MSGHSKWSSIKRQKAITDTKRGNLFTKLGNTISIAAREGGADASANFKLRLAIDRAKAVNMPKDNIERAIKRGTGELRGDIIEELIYGALLPGQIAVIIKCLSDNKNRTLTNVKTAVVKNGGQFVDLNSIVWQFENKGVIKISKVRDQQSQRSNQEMEMFIIEAGADDYSQDKDEIIVYTRPEDLQSVKENLERNNIEVDSADLEMVAKDRKEVDNITFEKVMKVLNALDEIDDVSDYFTNLK